MPTITENILEETCLAWLSELGWNIEDGSDNDALFTTNVKIMEKT